MKGNSLFRLKYIKKLNSLLHMILLFKNTNDYIMIVYQQRVSFSKFEINWKILCNECITALYYNRNEWVFNMVYTKTNISILQRRDHLFRLNSTWKNSLRKNVLF